MLFSNLFDRDTTRSRNTAKKTRSRKSRKATFRSEMARGLRIEPLEERRLLTVDLVGSVNWLAQGPMPIINGQTENVPSTGAGVNPVVGAIHDIALHPSDPDIAYLGTVNGGVFKSTDFSSLNPTYTPLTDHFPGTQIGALEFDPTDATYNTLVAGIGNFSAFSSGVGGNQTPLTGLLRTTDGGHTWQPLGVTDLNGRNISGVAARGQTIVATANTLGQGMGGGVYRSTDGGINFALISGSGGLATGAGLDLVGDPTNISRLYASVQGVGIFRSDNIGATWTNISSGDALLNTRITSGGNNNLEMAVSPTTGRIYAGVVTNGGLVSAGAADGYIGFSDDQGATWTAMEIPATNDSEGVFSTSPKNKPGGQGTIHFSIVVDPIVHTTVYIGGDRQPHDFPNVTNTIGAADFSGRLFRGDTTVAAGAPGTAVVGSAQWDHLTHTQNLVFAGGGTASNSAPHADSRDMAFRADGQLIESDDGGIYRRTNPQNNTGDWFSMMGVNSGLQVTEMHDIAYDNLSDIILSGNQDTGSPQQLGTNSSIWTSIPLVPPLFGGFFPFSTADGGDVAVDNLIGGNQSLRYSSTQDLGLDNLGNPASFRRQVYDAAGTLVSQSVPTLTGLALNDVQFVTPTETNEVAASRLIIGGASNTYESMDRGDNLATISAAGVNRGAVSYGASLNGVPNPEALFIGTGAAVLGRTAAGALTPTAALPGGATFVTDVEMNPDNFNTVIAVDVNQVFMSTNAGGGWADITGNLADTNLRSIEYIDNSGLGPDAILVGGAGGVFRMTTDAPMVWSEFGTGLPNSVVYDMDYDASDDVLVVGTLGRGAFTLPALSSTVFVGEERVLQITGDDDFAGQDDTITLIRNAVTPDFLDVIVNGVPFGPFELALLDKIDIDALGGNDTLIVDSTNGLIEVPQGIDFDGGGGFDQVDVQQTGGSATGVTETVNIGSLPGDGQHILTSAAGTQAIDFQNVEPITTVVPAATFNITSVPTIASLLQDDNQINYEDALILTNPPDAVFRNLFGGNELLFSCA